jgi:hypothetical protein
MQIPQQPPEEEQRQASQPLYEFVTDTSLRSDERNASSRGTPPGAFLNAHKDDSSLPATSTGEEQDVTATAPSSAQGSKQTPSGDAAAQQPGAQATTPGSGRPPPSADAIRQGLVYPPPPSFYQDVEESSVQPLPLPPQAPGMTPLPVSGLTPSMPPASYIANRSGTEHISPPPFVPIPPPSMPVPPAQKSRKWMWIVIALLGGVLVLSCGLCTWAGYMLVAPTVQDETSALSLVNNYYDAIQARNYDAAYSYLAPQNKNSILTREQFIQQAEKRDSQYGSVRTYESGQPSIPGNPGGNGPNSLTLSHLTITVNVTRAHLNYAVQLSLEKTGGGWKIVKFNEI